MTTEFMNNLTTLLDRWDKLEATAAQKLDTAEQTTQGAYFAGVMFAMEVARDDLAEALASAMAETTHN